MGCMQSKPVVAGAMNNASRKAEGLGQAVSLTSNADVDNKNGNSRSKSPARIAVSSSGSGGHSDPLAPLPYGRSVSNSSTHSDGSAHSTTSSSGRKGKGMGHSRSNGSVLGLDKMIDEKRDAKTMSERVVHIEVPFGKPIEEVYNGVHDGPVLGSGISGLVRLVTHKATGLKYAVKCLDLGLVDTDEGLQQLREEIYIMCQLDHPNIVRLEEVYESHSEIYLVQELCLGGELFDRLDEQPDYHYSEAQCARLIKQMLCSVRYIHSKGIIHRDLKLENFLFSSSSADSELKMIDFGLSKHFKFGEVQNEAVGTPYTVAPEVIRGSYDERCDVWAIGVITYLLLSGESPFGGCGGPEPLMQVRDNILRCNFVFEPEEIWEAVSVKAKQFIKRLLVTNPNKRPTAREAQHDPWLIEMADLNRNQDDNALNPSVVKALVNFKEYSDMRKLLCEVLSFTLIPDQIQGLRKEFEKMDTDGSGEISMSALKTVLLGNAAQGSLGALTEKEVEDIFNAMRVSKTEATIHWHEFIAAGLSHCKVDERNLRLAFDRLDSDHTGYITFENFMDLIGNGAAHSEEALREMWGEASMSSKDACITYEDFLLLMKGQTKSSQPKVVQPKKLINKLELHSVMEAGTGSTSPESGGGFMCATSLDAEEELSDGPIYINDDSDNGVLNQGFAEAVRHQGSGVVIEESLVQPSAVKSSSVDMKASRSNSYDKVNSHSSRQAPKHKIIGMNMPEHDRTDAKVNSLLNDKSKTPLFVNRELYRAHRIMRLAVLDASKRLDDERQRRAREEMRKEQALSNKVGAGLIMRHGGELSAEAIKQFVVQQQKEEQKQVHHACKRAGRDHRHPRNRTSSDIRGMFGSYGSELANLTSTATTRFHEEAKVGGIPDFGPPTPRHPLSTTKPIPESPIATDLPELPVVRNPTMPGQFRKTDYDPFSFGVMKESDRLVCADEALPDSSMHRHLNKSGPILKKQGSDGSTKDGSTKSSRSLSSGRVL